MTNIGWFHRKQWFQVLTLAVGALGGSLGGWLGESGLLGGSFFWEERSNNMGDFIDVHEDSNQSTLLVIASDMGDHPSTWAMYGNINYSNNWC